MAAVHKRSAYTKTSRTNDGGSNNDGGSTSFFPNIFLYTLIGQEAKLTMFCTFQHGSQLVFELI